MLDRVMKFTKVHIFIILLVLLLAILYNIPYVKDGFIVLVGGDLQLVKEGFQDAPVCGRCTRPSPCGCSKSGFGSGSGSSAQKPAPIAPCPRVVEPDLSKYILKSQIPVCNKSTVPEMTNYMLKTECPPVPDLSKYVLKSSIPKPQPVIIDNSSCKKDSGECPPCPRPRCPVVTCPPPTKCAPPAPCPRPVCPPTVVKCKSEEASQPTVRPFLAPLNMGGFGSA